MGKTFHGRQLEGLKRQGDVSVWIPLGIYATEEDLAAARSAAERRGDLVEFREFAYFLDDCSPERSVRQPLAPKVVFDDTHLLA